MKELKTMKGMDGYAYSGNIYFDGKKAGSICNDGYGGPTDVCAGEDCVPYRPAGRFRFVKRRRHTIHKFR